MIYIPTCGRWERIKTIEKFPIHLKKKVCLVVQDKEWKNYYPRYNGMVNCIIKLSPGITTIEPTRRFIWERTKEKNINKFFIVDDDLTWCKRIPGDYKHTRYASSEDIAYMFSRLYKELDNYGHVAVSERLGNNRKEDEWAYVTKEIRCVGYNHKKIPFNKLKFGRMEVMEDYDLTLQLLRLKIENAVWYQFCQEQGASNGKGGCSFWRTLELHNKNAKKLAKFHPEFVNVVEKQTKHGWFNKEGVNTRLDVRVQWKKAYNESSKS